MSLSDKIKPYHLYDEKDVKEAVKELKEAIDVLDNNMPTCESYPNCRDINRISWNNFIKEIDKIFGDELTKEKIAKG